MHNTPTTYLQRFGDAMELLCGTRPSDQQLMGWIDGTSESLQEFAIDHGPEWAQGIGVIDAALVLTDQPTEGVEHEFLPEVGAAQALDEMMRAWVPAEFHQRVRSMVAALAKPAEAPVRFLVGGIGEPLSEAATWSHHPTLEELATIGHAVEVTPLYARELAGGGA